MQKSRLPAGGTNLFQAIKAKCAQAEAAGQKLIRLSIGQPTGPALLPARQAAAQAIMSDQESMHEYQDNGSPGLPDFAQQFVQRHVQHDLTGLTTAKKIAFLPLPGIKPMLGLIPLACGAAQHFIEVATTTDPGYPTPADWCKYLSANNRHLTLNPENNFRFGMDQLDGPKNLVMINYPHNPSGQVASREWLEELCAFAQEHDIRLFNDAAYAMLAHSEEHCTLTDVAADQSKFPDLSWTEAFSASKLGNMTGWRVGAIVGSPDFVGDIATIKGNTDSGFVAPMAAGALELVENHFDQVIKVRHQYGNRILMLVDTLTGQGMKLAVKPGGGFFTLWQVPKMAFGQEIQDAQYFNFLMIEKTGIVGVHFHPYIRYAVVGPVEDWIGQIETAFKEANVSY